MTSREHIRKITLAPTAAIRESARVIQDQDIKLVLICDEAGVLLGTVTDGDIRRAVLNRVDLEGPVETIMNRHPKVTHQHSNRREIREYMRNAVIRHLPEVDETGRVVDIFFLDGADMPARMDNPVVMMAGGQGLRLRPHTETVPKALLEVGGRPVLQRAIEQLIGQGFHRFYLSINYLGHMVEEYFGDGSQLGVTIGYIRETEPMGTAGALSLLEPQELPILVMNGDIITKSDFRAMVQECADGVAGVMGVREHTYTVPYGCIELDGERIRWIREKPRFRHLICGGIYVLSPKAQTYLPKGRFFDMPDLFQKMIDAGEPTRHFQITEEWIDIGSKEDLNWARQLYGAGDDRD